MWRSLLWVEMCAVRRVFGAEWRKRGQGFERAWRVVSGEWGVAMRGVMW